MSDDFDAEAGQDLPAGARAARAASDRMFLLRWFGCWIDFWVLALLFSLPTLVLIALVGDLGGAAIIFGLLGPALYFPVTEGLWGRSLGKLAMGTIVVDADGDRPAMWRILVRTLTRLIEVNPIVLAGLPAGVIALFNPNLQRLGDILAGTYVVPVKTLRDVRARMAKRDLSAPG